MSTSGRDVASAAALFAGDGEMRARCRALDWSSTPLGPVEDWSQSLRTAVQIALCSPLPTTLKWGPELIQVYNERYGELLGSKHPAALGQPVRSCWPEYENSAIYERVLGGESITLEDARFPRDRLGVFDETAFSMSYCPVCDDSGNVAGMLVTVIETTQSRRTAAALRASEDRLAFLLQLSERVHLLEDPVRIQQESCVLLGKHLSLDRVTYVDVAGDDFIARPGYVNDLPPIRDGRSAIATFGRFLLATYPRGAIVAVNDIETDARLSSEERQAYRSIQVAAFTSAMLVKNGQWVGAFTAQSRTPRAWTEAELQLTSDVADRVWAAVDRARAEAALKTSELRLRSLVENLRDYAIFLLDASGIVTEWTVGAEQVQGYKAEEVIGRSVAMFYTAEDIASGLFARELAEAALTGRVERETWRVRKDGSPFWVNEISTAVHDHEGNVIGFTTISRDLSEQKRLQQQREDLLTAVTAAHQDAKLANKAKDDFLATLSHELRTPLAAILLWGGALRSGAVPLHELGRAVEAIVQSAESQTRLIEDLLDLSRLTSGKLLLAPASTRVADIARTALDVMQPTAQAKGVTLEAELPGELGSAMLDATRLRQVLLNLLSNATKFTPKGGKVTLRLERRKDNLLVDVIDTGEGISPDFMPYIFERFRQADMAETRPHGGLGIGLALCRQLAELQGGSIEAHSEGPGRGAHFRVQLPWIDGGIPQPRWTANDAKQAGKSALEHLRVLLVEDDPNTREAMQWTLDQAGATVLPVGSAAEALALLDGSDPGERSNAEPLVIVSDLGLPGMSGYELIALIAERRRTRGLELLPACAVSAHAREVDRQRAIAAGFDLYLAKPVAPERLVQAVADLRQLAVTLP